MNNLELLKMALLKSAEEQNENEQHIKNIKHYVSDNTSSLIPAAAISMYAGGYGLQKMNEKILKSNVEAETRYKIFLAENKKLQAELNELEKEPETPAIREEKRTLQNNIRANKYKIISYAKNLGGSPSTALKSTGEGLKWASIPLAGLTAYSGIKKATTGDARIFQDKDSSQFYENGTLGNALLFGGIASGSYGILSGRGTDEETIENYKDKIKEMTDTTDDKSISKQLSELHSQGTQDFKNTSALRRAKFIGTGMGLVGVGTALKYLSASPEQVANEKQKLYKELEERNLIKHSSYYLNKSASAADKIRKGTRYAGTALGVLTSGGINIPVGVGAHVLGNIGVAYGMNKGNHSLKMVKHIIEGNLGKAYGKTELESSKGALGNALMGSTYNPDAAFVVRDEGRHLGKALKEAGVDFTNLTPIQKETLKHLRKGDFYRAMHMAKYDPGLMKFIESNNSPDFNKELRAALNNLNRVSDEEIAHINNTFQDTSLGRVQKILSGNTGGNLPARKVPGVKLHYGIGENKFVNKLVDKLPNRIKGFMSKQYYNKNIDEKSKKVLDLENYNVNLDKHKNKETLFEAGIGGMVGHEEASLGVWNSILKPSISDAMGPFVNKVSKYRNMALGFSGGKREERSLGPFISDTLLSPAMSDLDATYDAIGTSLGTFVKAHKDIPKGLKQKLHNYALDPITEAKNDSIRTKASSIPSTEKIKKEFNSNKFETEKQAVGDILKNREQNNGVFKAEEVGQVAKEYATKRADDINNLATNEAIKKDFGETEKISNATSAIDNMSNRLGMKGLVGGSVLLTAPLLANDYSKYKERKRKHLAKEMGGQKHLKKRASDDSQNQNIITNTIFPNAAYASAGFGGAHLVHSFIDHNKNIGAKKELARIRSFDSSFNILEAKEYIDKIKSDPSLKEFKNSSEFKELEKEVNAHVKELEKVYKGDDYKRLEEFENKLKSQIKPINKYKGDMKAIKQAVFESALALAKLKKDPSKLVESFKTEGHELAKKIVEKQEAVDKKFKKSFYDGKGYDAFNKLHNRFNRNQMKVTDPKSLKVGALGALGGIALGHGINYIANKTTNPYKDDRKEVKTDFVAPTATGAVLGGVGGLWLGKKIRNFVNRTTSNAMENPHLEPSESLALKYTFGLGDMSNEVISDELAHYHDKRHKIISDIIQGKKNTDLLVDRKKILKEQERTMKSDFNNNFENTIQGISAGAFLGGMSAINNNIEEKNKVSRKNYIDSLVKQSSADNDNNFNSAGDYLFPATVAVTSTGIGGVLGYNQGKEAVLKNEPNLKTADKFYNELQELKSRGMENYKKDYTKLINPYFHKNSLESIKSLDGGYKDIDEDIKKYQELAERSSKLEAEQNKNTAYIKFEEDRVRKSPEEVTKMLKENPKIFEGIKKNEEHLDIGRRINMDTLKHFEDISNRIPDNFTEKYRKNMPIKYMKRGLAIGGGVGAIAGLGMLYDLKHVSPEQQG